MQYGLLINIYENNFVIKPESRKFFIMNESDCRTALAMRKQYLEENLDIIAQRHKILGDELVLVNLTKNALDNI